MTPLGDRGVCQQLTSCKPLMHVLQWHKHEIGNLLQDSVCHHHGKETLYCCPIAPNNDNNIENNNENSNKNNNNNNVKPATPPTATSLYGPLLPPVCGTTDVMYGKVVNTAERSEYAFLKLSQHQYFASKF